MLGFLGGISRKIALSAVGATLASGGAVGLSHSMPDILRKAGVACSSLESVLNTLKEVKPTIQSGDGNKKQLLGGKRYISVSSGSKRSRQKIFDFSKMKDDGDVNRICVAEFKKTQENATN